jgi:hypothetical protein
MFSDNDNLKKQVNKPVNKNSEHEAWMLHIKKMLNNSFWGNSEPVDVFRLYDARVAQDIAQMSKSIMNSKSMKNYQCNLDDVFEKLK